MNIFLNKLKDYSKHKIYLFYLYINTSIKSLGRRSKINNYIKKNSIRKIHIGCSHSTRDGWLATDLIPKSKDVVYLDATDRFPFGNETINYIFCEHMIEHINFLQARIMLKECYRVLKPGGKIRIATPDLDKYLSLITDSSNINNKKISDFYLDKLFTAYPNDSNAAFHILNLEMHSWGHQYLYNNDTLKDQLAYNKFKDITYCETSMSQDPNLQNLEMHAESAEKNGIFDEVDFFNFETVILEGSK